MPEPPSEPLALLRQWYAEAEACEAIPYAAAMCLSTVDADGLPDARMVLLESFDESGFVFFTDTDSPKARDLERRPEAALTLYWGPLDRQVRLRGPVARLPAAAAEACFRRRPRASQVTAWASRQSRVLDSEPALAERYEREERRLADVDPIPCPPHWRAFRLEPRTLELWQARARRLHERRLYRREGSGAWVASRLEP